MINFAVHSQYMIASLKKMDEAPNKSREREVFAEKAYYDAEKILNFSNLIPGAYFIYPNEEPFVPEMSKKEIQIRKKIKQLMERTKRIEEIKEHQRARSQKIKNILKTV